MFGLVSAIDASGTERIDRVILVGLVVMGCIPTTISSNVVMTRAAKGNDSVSPQIMYRSFRGHLDRGYNRQYPRSIFVACSDEDVSLIFTCFRRTCPGIQWCGTVICQCIQATWMCALCTVCFGPAYSIRISKANELGNGQSIPPTR